MTTEEAVDSPKKRRGGWPKGKPRKPPLEDKILEPPPTEAPIHVRLRLKDYGEDIEFGCARRLVENGFHVFFYPSRRDPYRETRREFAIDRIIEIEITEARQVYDFRQSQTVVAPTFPSAPPEVVAPAPRLVGTPQIHSAKDYALRRMAEAKREETGPMKLDTIPGISFGGSDT